MTDDVLLWERREGLLGFPDTKPPTTRMFVGAAIVGVLGDLAIRSGVTTLAMALLVLGTSAALLASGRFTNRQAQWLVVTAPVFGAWAAVRTSPWLVPIDLAVAFALLALAGTIASEGSVTNLWLIDIGRRGLRTLGLLALGPCFAASHVRRVLHLDRVTESAGRWVPFARGLAVAVPVVALLGALLASADVVFAAMFQPRFEAESLLGHVFLIGLTGWVLFGLFGVASTPSPPPETNQVVRLGPVELTVILGSVIALFGSFVLTKIVTAIGGASHVLETEGLTYAEYARSGFFQLLWVCGLTVAGLLGLRAAAVLPSPGSRRRFVVLSEVVLGLAVAIAAVALRGLALYNHAYGLTMLRLFSTVFVVWVAAVTVLLGVWLAGMGAGRCWFPSVSLGVGLLGLLWLNVINPEAVVVRSNLAHQRVAPLDAEYVGTLSDDAVPTAISLLPTLDPAVRAQVLAAIGCPVDKHEGWADFNVGASRAEEARKAFCST